MNKPGRDRVGNFVEVEEYNQWRSTSVGLLVEEY